MNQPTPLSAEPSGLNAELNALLRRARESRVLAFRDLEQIVPPSRRTPELYAALRALAESEGIELVGDPSAPLRVVGEDGGARCVRLARSDRNGVRTLATAGGHRPRRDPRLRQRGHGSAGRRERP